MEADRIMLRFRPIAPKPIAGATAFRAFSPDGNELYSRCGGGGRRFPSVSDSYYTNNNNSDGNEQCNRRRKHSPKQNFSDPAVTLPLLPETHDPKSFPSADLPPPAVRKKRNKVNKPSCLSFEIRAPDRRPAEMPAGSFVTVDRVMERWMEDDGGGGGLGSTDEERRVNLSKDTCPGFISDGYGRVTWTNKSFREMVGHEGKETDSDTVWLVMKDKMVGMRYHRSLTCRVKVQYTCRKENGSLTLPCDVWIMDSGDFAWRLDVKAALSLKNLTEPNEIAGNETT